MYPGPASADALLSKRGVFGWDVTRGVFVTGVFLVGCHIPLEASSSTRPTSWPGLPCPTPGPPEPPACPPADPPGPPAGPPHDLETAVDLDSMEYLGRRRGEWERGGG